jgi:hypothetical protein
MNGLFRSASLGFAAVKDSLNYSGLQNFRTRLLVQAVSLRSCLIELVPPFLVAVQGSDYNKNAKNS